MNKNQKFVSLYTLAKGNVLFLISKRHIGEDLKELFNWT